ncbi:MAG: dethiobiotin synthase [Cyclobacteriaceae bacterium]
MESKKIIVAGIGTDTGKTVVSAILCEALKADYWKPIQAGDLENSDSIKVGGLISNDETVIHPEAYRLETPVSPHAAAEIDGIEIDQTKIVIPQTTNHLIIEFAGGLMVPLSKNYLNIDWVAEVDLPVVLVSNYYLGSINHTLLSLQLLESQNVEVLGLVFNGEKNKSSFDVIMHRSQVPCLLELSRQDQINSETIREYAQRISI